MQIINSKSQIVEKILRDKEGRLVRVKFCVYENGGRIKARLVDFVYVNEVTGNVQNFALPGFVKNSKFWTKFFEKSYTSPFFNLDNLNLSGSKPRAPTFI